MKGSKLIIFGIALAVCSLAASTMNVIGLCGGGIGFIIAVAGLFKRD